MRENSAESREWARLGNAFAQFVDDPTGLLTRSSISRQEAALYAAAAFYCGGYPASAYIAMNAMRPVPTEGIVRACFDLIARPGEPASIEVRNLLDALRVGNAAFLNEASLHERRHCWRLLLVLMNGCQPDSTNSCCDGLPSSICARFCPHGEMDSGNP